MERINYSRQSRVFMYFILILGIISFVTALFYIYQILFSGNNVITGRHVITLFFIIALIIIGLISIFVWIANNKYRHYYIEWDDMEFRYRSPDSPDTQTISLDHIVNAQIKLHKLEFTLSDHSNKVLDLEGLGFDDLQKIKSKFGV